MTRTNKKSALQSNLNLIIMSKQSQIFKLIPLNNNVLAQLPYLFCAFLTWPKICTSSFHYISAATKTILKNCRKHLSASTTILFAGGVQDFMLLCPGCARHCVVLLVLSCPYPLTSYWVVLE